MPSPRPPENVEALVIDYDGTLTNEPGYIDPAVRDAVVKASKIVKVYFCTGRAYAFVVNLARELGLDTCHVVDGGGRVVAADGNIVWERFIPAEIITRIIDLAAGWNCFIKVHIGGEQFERAPLKGELDRVTHLLCCHHERGVVESFLRQLQEGMGSFLHAVLAHYHDEAGRPVWLTSITAKDANKQHALLHLARFEGIDLKNVVAVGDGYNDFPLLMACGFRVAMGNAPQELKEIADYVCPSVEEGGLTDVIERFILPSNNH